MRASGSVDSARSLGPHDHVCWVYEDHADFLDAMVEFLAEGRASDQRVQYVARGDRAALHRHVDGLDGADGTATGPVLVLSLDDVYELGETVGPEAQVAAYQSATEQALADGFTGLRVAAEATPLVRSPALFRRTLADVMAGTDVRAGWERAGRSEVTIDARHLTFVDHRGLAALDDEAGRHFTTIVLRTPLSTSRRLVELLDLGAVRVEAPV
ncbi:MAG TPA: MEDS domain-containing protein [Acidimicrobiales bacterium]